MRGAGFFLLGAALALCAAAPAPSARAWGLRTQRVPDCEALARQEAIATGIPGGLLPSIARIEAGRGRGRNRRAWPWTLNQGGKGMFFATKAAALAYLKDAVAHGVTNIDVGCMQLNYRWHGRGFASLDEMLDPVRNVSYAAGFLKDLRQATGSWKQATAHYHSADPTLGADYEERVARSRIRMAGVRPGPMPQAPAPAATAQAALAPAVQSVMAAGQPLFAAADIRPLFSSDASDASSSGGAPSDPYAQLIAAVGNGTARPDMARARIAERE